MKNTDYLTKTSSWCDYVPTDAGRDSCVRLTQHFHTRKPHTQMSQQELKDAVFIADKALCFYNPNPASIGSCLVTALSVDAIVDIVSTPDGVQRFADYSQANNLNGAVAVMSKIYDLERRIEKEAQKIATHSKSVTGDELRKASEACIKLAEQQKTFENHGTLAQREDVVKKSNALACLLRDHPHEEDKIQQVYGQLEKLQLEMILSDPNTRNNYYANIQQLQEEQQVNNEDTRSLHSKLISGTYGLERVLAHTLYIPAKIGRNMEKASEKFENKVMKQMSKDPNKDCVIFEGGEEEQIDCSLSGEQTGESLEFYIF